METTKAAAVGHYVRLPARARRVNRQVQTPGDGFASHLVANSSQFGLCGGAGSRWAAKKGFFTGFRGRQRGF
jgi:hypothetical protein